MQVDFGLNKTQRGYVTQALKLWRVAKLERAHADAEVERARAVAALECATRLQLALSASESEGAAHARRMNIFPDSYFEAFVGYAGKDIADCVSLPFENRDAAVEEILGTMLANFDLAESLRTLASDTKFTITTLSQMWGSGKTALVANFAARARTLHGRGLLPDARTTHPRFAEAMRARVVSIDLRYDSAPPPNVEGLNVWVNETVCRALASLLTGTSALAEFRDTVGEDSDCKRTAPCARRLVTHFSKSCGARAVLHFDEIDMFLERGATDGARVLMVFWSMMVDLMCAGAHVIFSGRTTYMCSMHALAVAHGGTSPTATLPLLLPPLSCAHVASILHGCAADFNTERSVFKFNALAIEGARTGIWLNLNDRGVVIALARTIHALTRGIPRFVKYAIAYMWSTGDGALGAGFDALLDRRAKFELTLRCPDGSSDLLHQLLLFATLRVPFDPLLLIDWRLAGDTAEEGRTLALSICRSFNFYIAPLPEAPGRWVVEIPPIYLRILSHCATPSMGAALTRVVRRQDLAGRVSGAPFERALTVMLAETFALAGAERLTVGAAVAGLGSGLVSGCVVPLAAKAAEAAQRLPKFVAQGASIKNEAEVAAAMADVAAGKCRVMNIENWPHVLRVLRAGGTGGFFVPSEKSRSADSYFIGADYAIGIQQKDNRESGSLTRVSIGAEAAVAFPQALLDAVKGPCSFVVAQTATLPPEAPLLADSHAVLRGDVLVGARWNAGATLGAYVVPHNMEVTLLNPDGVRVLLGELNAAAFLGPTDTMFTGLLLAEQSQQAAT